MPLFDFECPLDGRFELLLKEAPKGRRSCPKCKARSPLVPALTVMRPDNMWAGHNVEGYGYVTSSSKLAKMRKDKHHVTLNGRNDIEAMKKIAEQGKKDREAKLEKAIKDAFDEGFANSGVIDSFGNATPDAFKKLSDEQITSINDDRIPGPKVTIRPKED